MRPVELGIDQESSEVLEAAYEALERFVYAEAPKIKRASLVARHENWVIKLPRPKAYLDRLRRLKMASIRDVIRHEKRATRRAYGLMAGKGHCASAQLIEDGVATAFYRRLGFSAHGSSILCDHTVCTSYAAGSVLGSFQTDVDKNVYCRFSSSEEHLIVAALVELRQSVVSLNRGGVFHHDLDAQNIIVNLTGRDAAEITIIDYEIAHLLDIATAQPKVDFVESWYQERCKRQSPGRAANDYDAFTSKDIWDVERHIGHFRGQ
jgi:serine/threonine protein kinase